MGEIVDRLAGIPGSSLFSKSTYTKKTPNPESDQQLVSLSLIG